MSDNPYESNNLTTAPQAPVQSNILVRLFKKLLKFFAGLIGLIVLIFVVVMVFSPSYSELEKEATPLIDDMVPKLSNITLEQMRAYLHPKVEQEQSTESLAKYLALFSKLGSYQSHEPAVRGNCNSKVGDETYSQCTFTVQAQYDDKAQITINMIKFDEQSTKVYSLKINSDALKE